MADVVVVHKFVSGKADGPDPTLVQPSKWNQDHNFSGGTDGQVLVRDSTQVDGANWVDGAGGLGSAATLTNRTAATAAVGDVVAISAANDSSVILDDTVGSVKKFVVAQGTPADTVAGPYALEGVIPGVKAQGAITRGDFVRKSATTKAVESTGVSISTTVVPPIGSLGIALTTAAASVVTVLWFMNPVAGRTAILVFGDIINNVAAATTSYLAVGQKVDADSTSIYAVPFKGIASKMFVRMTTAAGGSRVATITLQKNASDTAVVVTITDPALTGNSAALSAAYAAGDAINVKVVTAAGAAPSRFGAVLQYDESP